MSDMKTSKFKEAMRAVKFTLFSLSAGIIQIGLFTLLFELLHWEEWVAYLIALVASVVWNFTLNRRFTFQSASNVPVAMVKVFAFYCVFTPVSTWLGNYLAETLLWNEYLVTILNMAANLILEYFYQRFFVFRNTIDTNDLAKK